MVDQQLVDAIYKSYEDKNAQEAERTYLGCSMMGGDCAAKVQYLHTHAAGDDFDGRMLRLFQTGHLEEPRFEDDLRAVGYQVVTVGKDGKQVAVGDESGHIKGHIDGVAKWKDGAWALLEMKTHSEKSFKILEKSGMQESKPEHFGQMQLYMGYLKLEHGLYIAKNKNTDHLYIERVEFVPAAFDKLTARGASILAGQEQPKNPSFKCNWCPAKTLCRPNGVEDQGDTKAVTLRSVSCRQCKYHKSASEGREGCMKHGRALSFSEVKVACDDHTLRPEYLTFAMIEDEDENLYRNEVNNEVFIVGPGGWTTKMLMGVPVSAVGEYNEVQKISETFRSTSIVVDGIDNEDEFDDIPF